MDTEAVCCSRNSQSPLESSTKPINQVQGRDGSFPVQSWGCLAAGDAHTGETLEGWHHYWDELGWKYSPSPMGIAEL